MSCHSVSSFSAQRAYILIRSSEYRFSAPPLLVGRFSRMKVCMSVLTLRGTVDVVLQIYALISSIASYCSCLSSASHDSLPLSSLASLCTTKAVPAFVFPFHELLKVEFTPCPPVRGQLLWPARCYRDIFERR